MGQQSSYANIRRLVSNRNSSNSKEAVQNPKSGTGVNFETAGGKMGYAGAGVEVTLGSKKEAAASGVGLKKQVTTVRNPISRQDQTIVTSTGRVVNVRGTPTPQSVVEERARLQVEDTLRRNPNMTPERRIDVQREALAQQQAKVDKFTSDRKVTKFEVGIDSKGFQQKKKEFANLGYTTSGELLDALKSGKVVATDNGMYFFTPEKTNQSVNVGSDKEALKFFAPRTTSLSETQSVSTPVKYKNPNATNTFNLNTQSEIHALTSADFKRPEYNTRGKYEQFKVGADKLSVSVNNFLNPSNPTDEQKLFQIAAVPARFVVGGVKGVYEMGTGVVDTAGSSPVVDSLRGEYSAVVNPAKWASFGSGVISGVSEGVGQQVGRIALGVGTGDVGSLSEEAGRIYAQTKVGRLGEKSLGSVWSSVKRPVANFNEARWIKSISDKDVSYRFDVNKYDVGGRKGVIVPEEYRGSLNVKNAPELQTQLVPKKVEGLGTQKSLFAPPDYTPMSFFESAKQLGVEDQMRLRSLTIEGGQTVLSTDLQNPRPLSSEQMLSVAKEQAGLKPVELQKTLLGLKPKQTVSEAFVLKDGKVVAKVSRNEVEIKSPLFAAPDPVSAAVITVYENRGAIADFGKSSYSKFVSEPLGELGLKGASVRGSVVLPIVKYKVGTPVLSSLSRGQSKVSVVGDTGRLGLSGVNYNVQVLDSSRSLGSSLGLSSVQSLGLAQTSTPVQSLANAQVQSLANAQVSSVYQVQGQRSLYKIGLDFGKSVSVETSEVTPKSPFRKLDTPSSKKRKRAFDVLVRKRGKFVKANLRPLERGEAVNFGKSVLSNTARASFRLKAVEAFDVGTFKGRGGPSYQFYQKGDSIIQKRSFRIGTVGEKREITQKGLFASRMKRKGLFGR
jgi:hypothetical protein